jgi:thiol-disulfide isomerase/thioredoxin
MEERKMKSEFARGVAFAVLAMMVGATVFWWQASDNPVMAETAVGQALPAFDLSDVDGKEHSLAQYAGKIVVVEFCNLGCPYSRGTDPDIIALAQGYASKGVVVLGIDSNAANTPADIKKHATETGKTYPILKDPENKYADAVGAKTTPEIYVVDKGGKLAYHGAFDDRAQPDKKGKTPYVENAVKALLDGKAVDPKEVKSWGCGIKRVTK